MEVQVRDASGNPISQAIVLFFAPGSNASAELSADEVRTNASGFASVTATANATAGTYQITAVAPTGGRTVFTLTNTPGAAATIEVVEGSPQSLRSTRIFLKRCGCGS